jgi:Protein of unknown function (DUF2924)
MNDACTPLSNLSSLADEGRTSVSQRWKQTLGRDIPANLRLELAVPILAYRIQEKHFGKLAPKIDRRLKALLELPHKSRADRPALRIQPHRTALKHGTRLLRSWQGTTYQVTVTDAGFEWDGKTYASLSVIAKAITGTHRSGPAFFGLHRTSKSAAQKNKQGNSHVGA